MTVCVPASTATKSECRREAVGRGGRGDADDDAGDQTQGTALEALVQNLPVLELRVLRIDNHGYL